MILTWRWWGYSLEGGTPLYKLYRYVPPHRVGFLHHFAGIRCGFRGNYRSVWTYLSFQFQMSKKEREICEFKGDFCLRSNLVMITLYLSKGQAWQRVWILEVWSENRSGKLHFLAWNRVRIWRTRWHTPTKNSQEYPPHPHPQDITKCYQERDCQNMFAIRRFHYILRFFFLDVILTGVRNISEFT